MKSHSPTRYRMAQAMICGITLAAAVVTFRAQADQWDKKTILTVDQPIQVRDRLLDPGRYVFKLAESSSDRHIVQIFNGDQSQIIDTILAIPNYRLRPTDKSQFVFWETPPGAAHALRAWFYPGDNFGQEFPYPKHLAMLTTPQPPEALPAPPAEPPAAEPAPPPPPQSKLEEPKPAEPPPAVAQNPPAPPEERPAPVEQKPEQLPKTASPYPLFGLGGLFSLALYGLLRTTRPT